MNDALTLRLHRDALLRVAAELRAAASIHAEHDWERAARALDEADEALRLANALRAALLALDALDEHDDRQMEIAI